MPLDEARQALLDVFCHCYGALLDHLDALDEATASHLHWDVYRVVRECVDKATGTFGSSFPETSDLIALCDDFVTRAGGFVVGQLGSDSPVTETLAGCKAAVLGSSVPSAVDLTSWQRLGEELSRECYQKVLPPDSPNLTRTVKPVSIVADNVQRVYCVPRKNGGESEITFHFASKRFTFKSYLNLPFYFFHEYLSHLHTAPLFGEHQPGPKSFEDGWLLYFAGRAYCHRLLIDPHPSLTQHLYREHYAERYLEDQAGENARQPWVSFGYEQARRFETVLTVFDPEMFEKVTLLVATSPYHYFPGIPDLHGEFVKRVKGWLVKTATLSAEDRRAKVRYLAAALKRDDPLKRLFDFLVEG